MDNVLIASRRKDAYSETWIHAHIQHLPAKVKTIYGHPFPKYTDDGKSLLTPAILPRRLLRAVQQRVLNLPRYHFHQAALKDFLLKNQTDVVLAEYGQTGVALVDVCRQAGVPLIVQFHGPDAYNHSVLEHEGRHYPELFESAAAIIAASHDLERQLLFLGAPREKLYCKRTLGVDTDLFQGADPAHAPPLFVAVGRFVDMKAPHLTLLAFSQVIENNPEAQLIMIGAGPLLEACKQLVRALGLAEAVQLLGPCSHIEVAATMRHARAFVQHSIKTSDGDSETLGVVFLEAGASGLPAVATRHDGIPEVVIEGKTGFLVDEGDVEGMAECMLQLAQDPILAAQLGKAARDWICAEFSMDKTINNLWSIIEIVIRGRSLKREDDSR